MSYIIEYAKTGRSKCQDKKCNQLIAKDDLRLGSVGYAGAYESIFFKHWNCVTSKQLANIGSVGNLQGFESLSAEDKIKVNNSVGNQKVISQQYMNDQAVIAKKKEEKAREKKEIQARAKQEKEERIASVAKERAERIRTQIENQARIKEEKESKARQKIQLQVRIAQDRQEKKRQKKEEIDRKFKETELKLKAIRELSTEQKASIQQKESTPKKSVTKKTVKKFPINSTQQQVESQIQTEKEVQVGEKRANETAMTPGKRIRRLPLKLHHFDTT